jgi:KRAB domain-containing zinc finger protein
MKEFKCEVCDKNFKYLSLYERHKRIHNNERTFKCEICDKTFNRPDTLKTHMNIHTGQGFECCGRFFHSKAALKYHQRSSHTVNVIKCKECEQTFEDQDKL